MKGAKPPTTSDQGIKGLLLDMERAKMQAEAKADGKKLFRLVMEEEATPEALNGLIYQASLLELIFHTLDHRKEITTAVSRQKSIDTRAQKTVRDQALVFDWCNKNVAQATELYKVLVPKVAAATNIKQLTTVRGFVSLWRKKHTGKQPFYLLCMQTEN